MPLLAEDSNGIKASVRILVSFPFDQIDWFIFRHGMENQLEASLIFENLRTMKKLESCVQLLDLNPT